MKKSIVTLYSFLVIVALILLSGWLGYTFYTGTNGSLTEFRENIPSLNSQVSDMLKETEDPDSEQFKTSMENFLQTRPEIKGLLIYSGDNRLFYTRLESKNNRLMENLQKNELFLMDQIQEGSYKPPFAMGHEASPLMSIRGTALNVSYIFETMSPVRIYHLLLNALYIISGLFVLTLLFLGILSLKEKNKGVDKNDDFFEPPAAEPSQVGEGFPPSPPVTDFTGEEALAGETDVENELSSLDFDLPDESAGTDDFGSMDFDLPVDTGEDDDLGSMDFDLPEESGEADDLESMDFDLPEESGEEDELGSMDFDLPEESGEEDELGSMDFDLPGESEEADDLESMDFDLPGESGEADDLESMDFDLPEESGEADDLESMDFDLPEESGEADDLESMDFDLPEESGEADDLESMDFDLPGESGEADDLESMDLDLPGESEEADDLESMDFDLPGESGEADDLESMDLDLPEESEEAEDLETMDFDLPNESEEKADEEVLDFDFSEESEEDSSLDEGGDLFDEMADLDVSDEESDELIDLPDEEEDLLEDLSDEDILGETLEIEDADDIEDLPDLEDFMADENLLDDMETEVSEENPKLYSPRSNVCWENFIDDRLPQELDRAASENEDLSFVYIRDISVQNDDDYKAFSEILTKEFPYRDLIFEWGDQGFAMILTNSDLVETLERLDVFINEQPEQDIRIGVTSRNGRLLDKDQLIEEASSAISKTTADNKIIGFRADPERYREAMSRE